MIIFKEIKTKNKQNYIVFENEKKSKIEIPVDDLIAKQFAVYFERLSPPKITKSEKLVESLFEEK